ncbi:MAG: acyl carrier protein [bacterium]
MEIEGAIRKFIEDDLLEDSMTELSNNDSLLEKGIIDSFNMVKLLTFIESTFSLKIDDEELMPENFDSISAIANFVKNKRQE